MGHRMDVLCTYIYIQYNHTCQLYIINLLAARLKCLEEIDILASLDNEFIIR